MSEFLKFGAVVALIGGAVMVYIFFQVDGIEANLSETIPTEVANKLEPKLKKHIKSTMIKAGLVDYDLIFKNDSIVGADTYNKIVNSNKSLLKNANKQNQTILNALVNAAVDSKVESEKAKIREERYSIKVGSQVLILRWEFNPQTNKWGLVED